ncbi:hypothetical protein Q673_11155 [Marinobacter sp. EN3]|uniref:lipopolysaccharide biosynthesis protein n=1 Tax=Marinobacter sp. EN3 TaxID=1397533 RepID=UPI0003B83BD8|nr:oligosaccharide flippase family protein [Marinobacter sp. EN3]ERS11285.1 hypothetical protein Q673_11155 [Marinobacter sp. EN3]
MIAKVKALTKSKFVRNVAIVATGTAGAQAITVAFAPLITRLYGPEAFGMLGTFMAILGVLTPVAALTYPIAIVLPKSDVDAISLAKLSAVLALAVALITALVMLVGGEWIALALSLEAVAGFLLLIPVAMVFSAYQQILTQWLIRKKQFKITARVAVFQTLVVNSAKAGVGWFHPVGAALVVITVIGLASHALLLWTGMKGRTEAHPRPQDERTGSTRELAKHHRDFPMYRAPQVALNALSQSLPVLMLASFFGPAAAGFYSLGKMVLGVPVTLIAKSVGDVFYPSVTKEINAGRSVFWLIGKATLGLAAIGAIPFISLIAFGPWIFSLIFGSEWSNAGEYAQWLALWLFFGFINIPSVAAVPALDLQSWLLFYEIVSTGAKLIALMIGFFVFDSDIVAVALMCVSGVFSYSLLIMKVLSKSHIGIRYEKAS